MWKPLIKALIWRTFSKNFSKVNLEKSINLKRTSLFTLHSSLFRYCYLISNKWGEVMVSWVGYHHFRYRIWYLGLQYWMCWESTTRSTHSSCESFRAESSREPNLIKILHSFKLTIHSSPSRWSHKVYIQCTTSAALVVFVV